MKILPTIRTNIALFDESEQRELRSLLSEFDNKKVNQFIYAAQFVCLAMLLNYPDEKDPSKYKKPSRTPHKNLFNDMKKQFAKTREYLELIGRESGPAFRPRYPSKLSDIYHKTTNELNNHDRTDFYQVNTKAVSLAQAALKNLEQLEALFNDNMSESLGKETINEEFAEHIAELYRKHLREPFWGINDPFPAVLKSLFNALQIKYDFTEKLAKKILSK